MRCEGWEGEAGVARREGLGDGSSLRETVNPIP